VIDRRELRLALDDGTDVAATFHLPAGPSWRIPVLLLPGARGDHGASHLVALAETLAAVGHPVLRAALSPRPAGSGVAGPAERSIGRLQMVLSAARRLLADQGGAGSDAAALDVQGARSLPAAPWVIGGASYGGRVASLAVAQVGARALGVVGLLLVAYPLHPPGRPEKLRVAHWPGIDVPTLMLSGDGDPFMTVGLLEQHAGDLAAPLTRLLIPGGRHDLSVPARSAPDGRRRTPEEAVGDHSGAVQTWLAGLSESRASGH
jgi:predicted alpha/beta-hydrolase family hydrolase